MDEPPCSPQCCPPLQLFLLTVLLLPNWKGLVQPPCPWCCQALASLQGASALCPQAAPHPNAHARLWLLISAVAANGFYPPATTNAMMSPLYAGSARGKGWDGEGSSQTCSLPTQLV